MLAAVRDDVYDNRSRIGLRVRQLLTGKHPGMRKARSRTKAARPGADHDGVCRVVHADGPSSFLQRPRLLARLQFLSEQNQQRIKSLERKLVETVAGLLEKLDEHGKINKQNRGSIRCCCSAC